MVCLFMYVYLPLFERSKLKDYSKYKKTTKYNCICETFTQKSKFLRVRVQYYIYEFRHFSAGVQRRIGVP